MTPTPEQPDRLLDGLLEDLGLQHWTPRPGDELRVGDFEVQYALGARGAEQPRRRPARRPDRRTSVVAAGVPAAPLDADG